jgi:hypothetical protein
MNSLRKTNFFEKFLLAVGIVIVIVGYGLIHKLILAKPVLSWDVVISIFMWMMIILFIILTAVAENVKEELRFIIKEETEKIKLLRSKR